MKFFIKSLLLLTTLVSSFAFAEIAVIVNSGNANAISDNDINRIFLGKNKTFSDGEKITAINLKSGNDIRTEFEKKALGKSSSQVKAYWSKLIFSGKAKPLKELASDSDVIKLVASTPNAIAYVNAGSVDDSVKVVKKL